MELACRSSESCPPYHGTKDDIDFNMKGKFTSSLALLAPEEGAEPTNTAKKLAHKRGRSPSCERSKDADAGSEGFSSDEERYDEPTDYDNSSNEAPWPICIREDSFYTSPEYLKRVAETRSLDVMVVEHSDGDFGALAPEWSNASGYGETAQEALDELKVMLQGLKEIAIEDEDPVALRGIPLEPSRETAAMLVERNSELFEQFMQDEKSHSWARITV